MVKQFMMMNILSLMKEMKKNLVNQYKIIKL